MASITRDPASSGDLPTITLREQLGRTDTSFEPWRVMIAAIASTVALFGAAAAFLKLIG